MAASFYLTAMRMLPVVLMIVHIVMVVTPYDADLDDADRGTHCL